jgi:hypothetical protein
VKIRIAVLIDLGILNFISLIDQIKAGHLGQVTPSFLIESIVGSQKYANVTGRGEDEFYGFEVKKDRHKFR